jgi:hypothetical protein
LLEGFDQRAREVFLVDGVLRFLLQELFVLAGQIDFALLPVVLVIHHTAIALHRRFIQLRRRVEAPEITTEASELERIDDGIEMARLKVRLTMLRFNETWANAQRAQTGLCARPTDPESPGK